jgi:Uncharacterized conserved protein
MAPKTRRLTKEIEKSPIRKSGRKIDKKSNKNNNKLENLENSDASTTKESKPNKASTTKLSTTKESTKESRTKERPSSKELRLKSAHPIITEQDIIESSSSQDLVELINSLTNTKQDEIFTKYRTKVQQELDNDHSVIEELTKTLQEKQSRIDQLERELESKRGDVYDVYESPIRKKKNIDLSTNLISRTISDLKSGNLSVNISVSSPSFKSLPYNLISHDQLSKELENIGFTLDMVELLTGLRIINFQEDDASFYFDVKQSNSSIFINYRLIISKSFASTAEISYVPTFLEEMDGEVDVEEVDNSRHLKAILPEYLCENLSFPYNTLGQFYGKVSRALSKHAASH